VVPVRVERVSRQLGGSPTLRGSGFWSVGLGPLEGHPYWVRDRAIKCAQSWSQSRAAGAPSQALRPRAEWATWAGRRDCLPRPFGYCAVMIVRMQACGRLGHGGSRPLVTEAFYLQLMCAGRALRRARPVDL
jgi:hypothetical protein